MRAFRLPIRRPARVRSSPGLRALKLYLLLKCNQSTQAIYRNNILDQPPLFPVPKKIKKQPPNHVVIVQWMSDTLTILAQTPVPHADKTQRRVLFVNHQPCLVLQLEAIGIARSTSRKTKRPDTILV
jgi:hypothetical protein